MATTIQLNNERRVRIAELLGRELGHFRPELDKYEGPVQLGQSLYIYRTSAAELIAKAEQGRPLAEACEDTGDWVHLIEAGNQTPFFAQTRGEGDLFLSLSHGKLAEALKAELLTVDAGFGDDTAVELVYVREPQIWFLILTRADVELAVIVSSNYATQGLGPRQLLSVGELVEGLRQLPKVIGVDLQ